MKGRHKCNKSPSDPTYSAQWSGVSYAPEAKRVYCARCGGHVHKEADAYYCPACDDYVRTVEKK